MRESAGGEGRYVSVQESCRWRSAECFARMWRRLGSVSGRCPAHSLAVEAEHGRGTAVITCHSGAGSQHPEPWEARTPGAAGFFGTCPSSHHMADGFLGPSVQLCSSSEGARTSAFTPWLSSPVFSKGFSASVWTVNFLLSLLALLNKGCDFP